jgi:hypothetical protein
MWTYFFGSPINTNYSKLNALTSSYIGYIDPSILLGYAGAGLALVLSCVGAYETAATLLKQIEYSFTSILQDL